VEPARPEEFVMVEEEPGSVENDLPAVEPPPRHDFSVVQGFQVVDAEDHRSARAGDEAWREALKLELEARAERLRQAVDAAIVLSNDGIIRWLGDPVAKLSPGANALNPSAVIFADECLPDVPRETIKTRIELWIAATTRRLLAPLFALEGLQEGPEIVRVLAHELVRSLGVLEREPIKAKIRTLSQDDRAELRKQGVRFGAYYLFLPMLLKPAARTLALQLWGLQASGHATEVVRTLAPVASSGRTSLSSDKGIGKEGYRVAGYRTCGERVVRVDVVERLAGMIRAAIAGEAPGGADGPPSQRTSKGFVVSGAMTSLTGCSGEQFASILRSMGFRSVEMKRSEFFASQSANETARQSEPLKPAEDQGSTRDEPAPPPAADEEEASAEIALAAPLTEPSSEGVLADADAVPEDGGAVPKGDDALAADVEASSAPVAAPEDTEIALHGGAVGADGADDLPEGALPEGALAVAEGAEPVPVDMTTSPAAGASDDSPGENASGQSVSPPTSDSRAEPAKNDEMIIVWRPDHRKTAPRREREAKHSRSEAPGRSDAQGPTPVPASNWRRDSPTHPPNGPNRPNSVRADEKRRQRPKDYDMALATPAAAPQKPAKVDPNSPFAKLLELRSLLEEQANKRR
jgi:ATP-dependent RNA helicase SUPV3L1/SUV3